MALGPGQMFSDLGASPGSATHFYGLVDTGEEGEGRMNWEISTDIYTHCVLSRVRLFVTPLTVTP